VWILIGEFYESPLNRSMKSNDGAKTKQLRLAGPPPILQSDDHPTARGKTSDTPDQKHDRIATRRSKKTLSLMSATNWNQSTGRRNNAHVDSSYVSGGSCSGVFLGDLTAYSSSHPSARAAVRNVRHAWISPASDSKALFRACFATCQ
jgi:hypothetical protein